jgi:RNA polymerase sigma factor (sigma-70 family)
MLPDRCVSFIEVIMRAKLESIPTRESLLSRLKDVENHASWKEFFETYWKLIYGMALKSGLNDAEAQDVVQETVIRVARSMPSFRYDPAIGSFKAWLRQLTRWRITDQVRRRGKEVPVAFSPSGDVENEEIGSTTPADSEFEALWEKEWNVAMLEAAIEKTRAEVDAKQFQIFELYVLRDLPVTKVSRTLGVNSARVYLAKHRVSQVMKRHLKQLEAEDRA